VSTSAFGIEHGDISKSDGEYRDSYFQSMNPRSKTKVKHGTKAKRIAIPYAGGAAGILAGAAVGSAAKSPGVRSALVTAGGIGGTTLGLQRNIKSKDTVSVNRRSGKKAKDKISLPVIGPLNLY